MPSPTAVRARASRRIDDVLQAAGAPAPAPLERSFAAVAGSLLASAHPALEALASRGFIETIDAGRGFREKGAHARAVARLLARAGLRGSGIALSDRWCDARGWIISARAAGQRLHFRTLRGPLPPERSEYADLDLLLAAARGTARAVEASVRFVDLDPEVDAPGAIAFIACLPAALHEALARADLLRAYGANGARPVLCEVDDENPRP